VVAPPPDPRTLVVIPAYNEEDPLPAVLDELRTVGPDLDILVIDDGSTDRTAEVAAKAGVAVVQLPFNLGIGGALRCGFRYAVRHDYERAVQFDADGQHDASEIAVLLARLDAGADIAIGSRFADASLTYDVGRVRAGAMSLLRFVVRQLSGQRFTDTSTGFRAFDRPVLELFAREYPAEYMESVEALVLALAAGYRVDEVPVHMTARLAGQPSNRRLRLLYHYLRLLLVIMVSAGRRVAPVAADEQASSPPPDPTAVRRT
jgi:glycosyltransferase involved in cell wall biosynthesis